MRDVTWFFITQMTSFVDSCIFSNPKVLDQILVPGMDLRDNELLYSEWRRLCKLFEAENKKFLRKMGLPVWKRHEFPVPTEIKAQSIIIRKYGL